MLETASCFSLRRELLHLFCEQVERGIVEAPRVLFDGSIVGLLDECHLADLARLVVQVGLGEPDDRFWYLSQLEGSLVLWPDLRVLVEALVVLGQRVDC